MRSARKAALVAVLGGVVLTGCGSDLNCALYGDNIKGRINFDSTVAPDRTAIRVQISQDGFSTVKDTKILNNSQGLLSVPFSYCADTNVTNSFRAFQDSNNNASYDAGEGSGRDDGTSTGNGTQKSYFFPTPNENSSPVVEWQSNHALDITIDTTGGL